MKNKLLLLAMGTVLSAQTLMAQAPAIEWQKCLGGTFYDGVSSIKQTTDGGFIVAGTTSSNDGDVSENNGDFDFWVVKLTTNGTIQWQKCYGGSSYDEAFDIIQTSDGGYIVGGVTQSNDGDVIGNNGNQRGWIIKLYSNGDIQWQIYVGGQHGSPNKIIQTVDGGYIVAGSKFCVSPPLLSADLWVIKLTSDGGIQWESCLGGSSYDVAFDIIQTSEGGYIVAGGTHSYNGNVIGNHGSADLWVVKLTNNGSLQWQKCYGGTNMDYAQSIFQTYDGGYIVAGITESNDGDVIGNHGGGDYWIVKLSNNGLIQWQKCLGGSLTEGMYGTYGPLCVLQDSVDGYILAGTTESNNGDVSGNNGNYDSWVVKLTIDGNIQWQKCIGGGGTDIAKSILKTLDGGYIVAGNYGFADGWLVKLNFNNLSQISNIKNDMLISPNPASTQININFNNITDLNGGSLKVINSLGQEVATTPITTSGTQSIMQLATWGGSGMYFVQIINPQGQIVDIKKIILQ